LTGNCQQQLVADGTLAGCLEAQSVERAFSILEESFLVQKGLIAGSPSFMPSLSRLHHGKTP